MIRHKELVKSKTKILKYEHVFKQEKIENKVEEEEEVKDTKNKKQEK